MKTTIALLIALLASISANVIMLSEVHRLNRRPVNQLMDRLALKIAEESAPYTNRAQAEDVWRDTNAAPFNGANLIDVIESSNGWIRYSSRADMQIHEDQESNVLRHAVLVNRKP